MDLGKLALLLAPSSVAAAGDALEGRNRRGRALGAICLGYLEHSGG